METEIKVKKAFDQRLQTEVMLRDVKTIFKSKLSQMLNLHEVSAPLFVKSNTGINDDLNGIEKSVIFTAKSIEFESLEIVQSLAKWKRLKLSEWKVPENQGIVVEMKALRPSEDISPIHSIYVDQWDWEKHIKSENRNLEYLKFTVANIYKSIYETQKEICSKYSELDFFLPSEITFIHSEELQALYPQLNSKQREFEISKQFGAVFIIGIGHKLADGKEHDLRAPDYDDWSSFTKSGFRGLNGDIIVWNPAINSSFEISSMGVRVDKKALIYQLEYTKTSKRKDLFFHSKLLSGQLSSSIGGGIGQSRLAMLILQKKHIGEVQASLWSKEVENQYSIDLL
ncbi:MAG: aspartate--ammonia ligase [Bacteroidales bacterium]|nr:aspartate--ammonia ligase [Bacteroidales bacterium]